MGCSNCKNNKELNNIDSGTPKLVIYTAILMFIFSLYGLFSFIQDLLNFFYE
jgi:hypothetical protein